MLAFRDNSMLVIDPEQGAIVRTLPFDIPQTDRCRTLTDPLPITGALYDTPRRILHLEFDTYACLPYYFSSVVSFDMKTNARIAQRSLSLDAATAHDGSLYGSSWYRMSIGYRWVWRDGQSWFESAGWDNSPRLFVDETRGRLYESDPIYGFRAFDLETMDLQFVLPAPVDGDLVGYDPGTDQLYFLRNGQLALWPAAAVLPPSPRASQLAHPPAKRVRPVILSSAGSQPPTLFGLWDHGLPELEDVCNVFGMEGGYFYASTDGGRSWRQPRQGLVGGCQRMSALAVSPAYASTGRYSPRS